MPLCIVSQAFHISTHALREEGDRIHCRRGLDNLIFLPTPSARRATANVP